MSEDLCDGGVCRLNVLLALGNRVAVGPHVHSVVVRPVEVPPFEQQLGFEPVGTVQAGALHVHAMRLTVPHVPRHLQRVPVEVGLVVHVVLLVPVADEGGVPRSGHEGVAHAGAVLDEPQRDVIGQEGGEGARHHHVGVQVDAAVQQQSLQTHYVRRMHHVRLLHPADTRGLRPVATRQRQECYHL